MPAELMARLRAEGLLPDDDDEQKRPQPPRPSTTLGARPSPVAPHSSQPPEPSAFDDVPSVHSDPPPAEVMFPAVQSSVPPPNPTLDTAPPPANAAPASLETPIAFVTPPSPAPLAAPIPEMPVVAEAEEDASPVRGRSRMQTIGVLLAVVVAFIAFAFAMALLSQRR